MSFLSRLFNRDSEDFDEVCVDREVLESVIYYAKKAYPNEFLSFFDGKIENNKLYITGLIFLPGETGNTGAVVHTEMLPPNMKYWGSVHSHPGPSAMPSGADLKTFSKHGVFHMIVCLPYSLETFKSYDKYGNPIDYTVGDYSDMREEVDDFFDENDVLTDGEVVKTGFFDDDFDLDDNPNNAYETYEKSQCPDTVVPLQNGSHIFIEIDNDGNIKKIIKK